MIYRSNLTAPDLSMHFKLTDQVVQHMGHDCPSDPDFDPKCTFLTHDEAAILYSISKAWKDRRWADIGSRLGWTARHIIEGGASDVWMVDPEYAASGAFSDRAMDQAGLGIPVAYTSEEFFTLAMRNAMNFDAAMIDGNHDDPEPTKDAMRARRAGCEVLVWHDFQGKPVRDAVSHILDVPNEKWLCRVYWTPNGMAVAWRLGCGFDPPDHVPDPNIDWSEIQARYSDFDFTRTV